MFITLTILISILYIGSIIAALIYTNTKYKRHECTFNYFGNPFLTHECEKCVKSDKKPLLHDDNKKLYLFRR